MIVGCLTTSFKKELLLGTHAFGTDTFKIALYSSSADINTTTTAYTTTGEVTGTGYTAGGATLTVVTPTTDGTVALVDFSDVTWSTATITARAALIYNSSKSNKSVAVLDFGSDRVKTAADFTITFPPPDRYDAIIRIA